jgi:hypothetical protein
LLVNLENLDLATLPNMPLTERKNLPPRPGIYFVFNQSEELVYIGRTISLCLRWSKHHRLQELLRMPHARIAWFAHDDVEDLPAIEAAFISKCQPQLNGRRLLQPFGGLLLDDKQVLQRTISTFVKLFSSSPVVFRGRAKP